MFELQFAAANTAGIASILAFWIFIGSAALRRLQQTMLKLGMLTLAVAFIAMTAAIVARGIASGRFPLSNLYESLLWFAWSTAGGFLCLGKLYPIRQLGWLASLSIATVFLYGSWLPASQHDMSPLAPALVSYWRQIHVPPLIASYALFLLSGLASLAALWAQGAKLSVAGAAGALAMAIIAIGLGTYTNINTAVLQGVFVGGSLVGLTASWLNLRQIQSCAVDEKASDLYDEVAQRAVLIGLPLLTVGIITGALWANHAWGSYWSWDPKESMALVTWLSYATYIHLRIKRFCTTGQLSVVAVAAMILTLLTYLGFSALGLAGLHSYGRIK